MATMTIKKLATPDETRPFASKGRAEIFRLEEGTVGRGIFEPGWKWSECVKPIAGTQSCEASHLGVCLSGRMRIRMNDGTEAEVGPGDLMQVEPGHDAWVVGDETCVMLDFSGMEHYAERAAGAGRAPGAEPQQPGMH
jgi:hypothetical protein